MTLFTRADPSGQVAGTLWLMLAPRGGRHVVQSHRRQGQGKVPVQIPWGYC